MTGPSIRLATTVDRDAVIETVVAAFDSDPAFRFFFPTDDSWARNAGAFAGALFDSRVRQEAVWIAGGVDAVAMWSRPGGGSIRSDFTVLDDDARARLAAYEAATHGGLPDEPFWYLGILATHPYQRGRRLGRTLMLEGLQAAAAEGFDCYLETTRESNLDIYRGSGWNVAAESSIDDLTIWVMRHRGIAR